MCNVVGMMKTLNVQFLNRFNEPVNSIKLPIPHTTPGNIEAIVEKIEISFTNAVKEVNQQMDALAILLNPTKQVVSVKVIVE